MTYILPGHSVCALTVFRVAMMNNVKLEVIIFLLRVMFGGWQFRLHKITFG